MEKEGAHIKTIVFDIGNVLIYDFPMECLYLYNIYKEINRYSPISYHDFFRHKPIIGVNDNKWVYSLGKEYFGESWIGIDSKAWNNVLENWKNLCIPINGAIEELKKNKDLYRYAICANQPIQAKEFMKNNDLVSLFDIILLDSEVGFSKPDEKIFSLLIKQLDDTPENIVMVGDKYENDIIPAKKANMKACLMKVDNQFISESLSSEWEKLYYFYYYSKTVEKGVEIKPDYTVNNMQELFEKLRKL